MGEATGQVLSCGRDALGEQREEDGYGTQDEDKPGVMMHRGVIRAFDGPHRCS